MHRADIPVARPLAWWNTQRGLFDQTSYFLYEKIDADCSLNEWCNAIRQSGGNNIEDLIGAAKTKAMMIVRAMHVAGFRHSDPHGNNFLVKLPVAKGLSLDDIEQSPYYLIDYDHCTKARVSIAPVKMFFDLKELRRVGIDGTGPHQLLDMYLDGKQSRCAHQVLAFWRRGGFYPWRWIVPEHDKKDGRHLKKPKQKIQA